MADDPAPSAGPTCEPWSSWAVRGARLRRGAFAWGRAPAGAAGIAASERGPERPYRSGDRRVVRGPATGQLASVAALADLQNLFNELLSNHGALAKGATSTVEGQKVVAVKDTRGGTLYVATKGKPYPIEVSKPGPQGGRVIFDRYDEAVSLSAPANSIDISKLR